jgi:acyl-CoA synthetase (AMP-forming)/AMP-acid ligase II
MVGYLDDESRSGGAMSGGYYRTGDVAQRDADGYITYVAAPTTSSRAPTIASARSRWRVR